MSNRLLDKEGPPGVPLWLFIVLPAVGYVVLNLLWLWAANSPEVGDAGRPFLKGLAIGLAVVVFVVSVAISAHRSGGSVKIPAVVGSAGVIVGTLLIIGASVWWRRGQFFHDATVTERVPSLISLVFQLGLAAAVVGLGIGALTRMFWRAQ